MRRPSPRFVSVLAALTAIVLGGSAALAQTPLFAPDQAHPTPPPFWCGDQPCATPNYPSPGERVPPAVSTPGTPHPTQPPLRETDEAGVRYLVPGIPSDNSSRPLARGGETVRVGDWYLTAPVGEDIRFGGMVLAAPCPCELWHFQHVRTDSRFKIDAATGLEVLTRSVRGPDQARTAAVLDEFVRSIRRA